MKSFESSDIKNNKEPSTFFNRRNFLKAFSTATVGGLSTFVLPEAFLSRAEARDVLRFLSESSGSLREELYWRYVKEQFSLNKDLIYLNTGTEGSMSKIVLSKVEEDFKRFAENPMEMLLYDDRCCMGMGEIRAKVAEFVGADTDEILMTTNTTEGLGFVSSGLELHEGDEVLTTQHFRPYNSCWYFIRDRKNVTLSFVELPTPAHNKDEILHAFEKAITPQTKVISFCHINYTTGLRMPVKEICRLAREHDIITVVDGAHAIGMIDINLHDFDCDFYATSPHKWLCAPPGTGVLYMRKDMQEYVWPTATEVYGSPERKVTLGYFQTRGQQCTPAYAAVMDAIDLQNAIGKDRIEARVLALQNYTKEKIINTWGAEKIISPLDEELSTGLVSFNPFDELYGTTGDNISTLFYSLIEQNIITRTVGFQDKLTDSNDMRALRISTHVYNNFSEIDTTFDAIQDIAADL